ncbi:MAG TPA: biopolymer transporter ExbD [Candidatus Paceibacterota bacterium]|nr:biopolymer transporter ExbD [Verrucomicrobiota bacterium]HSA09378.1 biopolymer transporter ExbD [Candidatus Paceibacterota bacterium]
MPVKLGTKHTADNPEARIEIIPLIDIMFFLLAAFMLVSLSLVNLKSVKVDLPTASAASAEAMRPLVSLTVNRSGVVFLDRKPVGSRELMTTLAAWHTTNQALRVCISGDREARHGDIIRVLDLVHAAGVDKVAFEIRTPTAQRAP